MPDTKCSLSDNTSCDTVETTDLAASAGSFALGLSSSPPIATVFAFHMTAIGIVILQLKPST